MRALRTGFQQTVSLRNRVLLRAGQSINLLQLSRLELDDAISQELESNPLLELAESPEEQEPATNSEIEEEFSDGDADWDEDTHEADLREGLQSQVADDFFDDVGDYKQLDQDESIEHDIEWDDRTEHVELKRSTEENDLTQFIENQSIEQDLSAHLLEQVQLSDCTEEEELIASVVFEFLNDDGLLSISVSDLLVEVNLIQPCTINELEEVLVLVQNFSPLGVCARNLQESLIIQTRASFGKDSIVPLALKLLKHRFDELASQRLDGLKSEFGEADVNEAVQFISHLNPRPAASFSRLNTEYIVPDARVRKVSGEWRVELLDDSFSRLKISDWYPVYQATFGRKGKKDNESSTLTKDREYLKEQHARAKLFLTSLQFRQNNVLKIVLEIVKHQQDFFEFGAQAMRPLVLVDVAEDIGLHTSTVSRLTRQKYLETPHGVLELKYFFSNRVGTQPGREHSSVAIRSVLRRMIQEEDPVRPLSDQRIAYLLKDKHIDISRRTVTKYRESMSIPASRNRRSVA